MLRACGFHLSVADPSSRLKNAGRQGVFSLRFTSGGRRYGLRNGGTNCERQPLAHSVFLSTFSRSTAEGPDVVHVPGRASGHIGALAQGKPRSSAKVARRCAWLREKTPLPLTSRPRPHRLRAAGFIPRQPPARRDHACAPVVLRTQRRTCPDSGTSQTHIALTCAVGVRMLMRPALRVPPNCETIPQDYRTRGFGMRDDYGTCRDGTRDQSM